MNIFNAPPDNWRIEKEGLVRFLIVAALVAALAAPGLAIDSDKLPFGSQVLRTYTEQEVQKLSEDMCFNYFVEYDTIGSTAIGRLYDEGIQTIRGGIVRSDSAEPPMMYSWSNYAIIDVDYPYPNDDIWMKNFGPDTNFANGMWVSYEGAIDTLSGISTYQDHFLPSPPNPPKNRVAFFDKYFFYFFGQQRKIQYRIDLFAAIDDPDTTSDEAVATVSVLAGKWDTCIMKPIYVDTLLVSDFGADSSLQWIQGELEFEIPDSFTVIDKSTTGCDDTTFYTNLDNGVNKRWSPYLRLDIVTTGEKEFKVDSIKISDQVGRELIDLGDYDNVITSQFQEYSDRPDSIYAWMLMDEPLFANIMPFHHIDSLMHEVHDDWLTFTNFWQYSGGARLIHTYLSMVDVDYVAPDIYPFGGSDVYAGELFQYYDTTRTGPLYRFPMHVSWVRKSVDQIDKDFWVTVQAFEDHRDPPDSRWRYPTASELSVQVFISLAWGCRGIQVWLYDPYRDDFRAIRDPEGGETWLYAEIRDHIGPYLQAFDEYYIPLIWDTCYTYKPDYNYKPPDGALIDTVYAISNSPDSNPDVGWFQVGEFHDESGDDYIMLVNRACSRGASDSTAAPSVTATVRFNPGVLGSDYVYIIDLADSLRLAGADTGWVGIPDTTYTAKMPDGTIPFTTVLGPGEGRLFKIVQTR